MRAKRRIVHAQSAMEYLTTYSWAILIIAVVIIALYSLGIFNGSAFTSKATAGSCQIYRPEGPLSISGIALTGACNNALPQFVAQFDGQTSSVSLGNSAALSSEAGANGDMTYCMWYLVNSLTNYHGPMLKGVTAPSSGNEWEYTLDQSGNQQGFTIWNGNGGNRAYYSYSSAPATGTWFFACFSYNAAASQTEYYLNGVSYTGTVVSTTNPSVGTGKVVIGSGEGGYSSIDAANIQIYNTSLSTNDLQALYLEGIGGAPIVLQNLVGWWPLNGNAYDYSGNSYNGTATSVTYTGQWTSGYTAP